MSLGSVLIKPQPVATPLPPQVDPTEVIVEFIEAFTRNPEGAAAAAEVFARVAPETLGNFVRGMEEKVRLSDGRIRALFLPFAGGIDAFLAGLGKDNFVDVLKGTLELVAAVLKQMTKARMKAFIRGFADIVTKDLGLSKQTLRDLVTTLATQIIGELKREVIAGEVTRTSIARYEFGAALDGLKSLFDEEEIELPALDVQVLIDAVDLLWDQGRIDRVLAWLLDLIAHADDVLAPLAVAIEARVTLKLQLEVDVTPAPVGAAVTEGTTIPRAPDGMTATPEPPVPGRQGPIAWYASWVAGKTLRYPAEESAPLNRFRNPELVGFTYRHAKLSKETMERMAFATAWAVPAAEALLLHVPSMEQGDVLSNLHITVLDALDFGLVLGDKGPIPNWWHWTVKPLMTMFLWGFESGWDRVGASNDPYVWTNALGDLGEVFLYWRWSRLVRELLLSICTLLNHEPGSPSFIEPVTGKPAVRNVERYEGVCYTFWELGSMLVPLIMWRTNRGNYGFVGGGPTGTFWGIAFGGFLVAAAFGYGSILIARLLAGEFFDDRLRYGLLVGRDRLYGPYRFQADFSSFSEGADSIGGWLGTPLAFIFMLAASIGDSPIYTYLFTDGSTDDGTLCTDTNGKERFAFQGYPDANISPYLLPWTGQQQCVQGNLGVWSHFPLGNMTYAYDFSHNVGTEVLCSRAGIVLRVDDTNPDNNPNTNNFVEVMHLTVNPTGGGLAAVPPPAGITNFADGATPIPAGTLFPPYWLPGTSTPLPGLPTPVPLHPSAAILPGATATAPGALAGAPAYYAGLNGFNAGTTFAFLIPGVDRGIAGVPAGATFSDGTPIAVAGSLVPPGTALPAPPSTTVYPAGTDFVFDNTNNLQPLQVTICDYRHCIFGFMQISTAPPSPPVPGITQTPRPSGLVDVYRSRSANQVLGLFVPQGRVIALSGDTGVSAFNHLHTQVIARSRALGGQWTIPFTYGDAVHGIVHGLREGLRGRGVPRSFTFYDSRNVRIAPT
jgi:hypothetical protein